MAAENEALKFKIDDIEYEFPTVDDLDMAEWEIIYARTGLILDDFISLLPVLVAMEAEADRLDAVAEELHLGSDEREKAEALAAQARTRLTEAQELATEKDRAAEVARQRRINQPGFTRAMIEIAYQRANPDAKLGVAEKIASEAKLIPVLKALNESQLGEEQPAPLGSTPERERSSPRTTGGSNEPGLSDSTKSSDEPDAQPEPIGITG